MESSSGFIAPSDFSSEWRDIRLVQTRSRTRIYTATRYGRRFVLKALTPEAGALTDYRLQQEREFQLGIMLVHPNIAATFSLEEVEGIGRCIVQEWIDGITLAGWLQTKPSKAARERVFNQLLDALEYLHGLQLVHHDLKSDNILVTRNGANVKLIDFGLSATDALISPVPNDPQTDIEALRRLFPSFVPRRRFANIAALRRAIRLRQRAARALPLSLLGVLLVFSCVLLYVSVNEREASQAEQMRLQQELENVTRERDAEQQRYEQTLACINFHIEQEREQLMELFNRKEKYDIYEYQACMEHYYEIRRRQWEVRDSLIATYDENDPLHEQIFHIWTHKEADIDNELHPLLGSKIQ